MTIQRNYRHKHKSEKHCLEKKCTWVIYISNQCFLWGPSSLSGFPSSRQRVTYLSCSPEIVTCPFQSDFLRPFGTVGLPQCGTLIEHFLPSSTSRTPWASEFLCSIETQSSGFDWASRPPNAGHTHECLGPYKLSTAGPLQTQPSLVQRASPRVWSFFLVRLSRTKHSSDEMSPICFKLTAIFLIKLYRLNLGWSGLHF